MDSALIDIDVDERKHHVKVLFAMMAFFAMLGMEAATASIASDCEYLEVLGRSIKLGEYQIYGFWNYWLWSYGEIGDKIPYIVRAG